MKGNFRHGHNRVGKRTPEYRAWVAMRARCYIPSQSGYSRYGGRGVSVCERWLKRFDYFLADMGHRPSSAYSLDRVDNSGNYEPHNCRWATKSQQAYNRVYKLTPQDIRQIHANAKTSTQSRIARHFGVSQTCISRILSGERHPIGTY